MSELLHTLGIDWKLLLAQAANFLVLVVILRLTVYKPLVKMLSERRKRIEQGMADAKAAHDRLENVEQIEKEKIAEAEREGLAILGRIEQTGKEREIEAIKALKKKEEDIITNAERVASARKLEKQEELYREAVGLVKQAMIKTVETRPEAIDEALIAKAIEQLKKS
jgi:F-type H+-transporting ATPase subunit b